MTTAPRTTRRLVRVALLAYPRAFRARFGDELARDAYQGIAKDGDWLGAISALVRDGFAERATAVVRVLTWRSHQPHLYTPSGRHASMWDTLRFELAAAVRGLTSARAFTALTVLALGLGLGANSAVFAVVQGVLLRPLPYAAPDRLAMLWSENPRLANGTNPLSPANFDDLKQMNRSFESLDYALSFIVRVGVQGQEDQGVVQVLRVGSGLLPLVGARTQLGRLMAPDERHVAVVSDRAWRTRFGADPSVVGRTIVLSGNESLTIVGVAAPEFVFPLRDMLWQASTTTSHVADLWVPMPMEGPRWIQPDGTLVRSAHALMAVGRLRPGVTAAQADAELRTHAGTLADRYPDTNRGWSVRVVDLHAQATGSMRVGLVALQAGALLLLLMAAANVTNLVLARSIARHRELAVRSALGASARHLVRQALMESLVLASAALALSTLIGSWLVRALVALAPATLPRLTDVGAGPETLAASAGLAVVIGVAIAIVPVWMASRTDVRGVLQDGSRGATGGSRSGQRLRTTLVVAEVTLAVVITIQAGLLFRSFAAVVGTDPGFQTEGLLTFQMATPDRLTSVDARRAFYDDWFARLHAIPHVTAAGGTTRIPLGSSSVTTSVRAEGNTDAASSLPEVEFRRASTGYFRAMGMPILKGRALRDTDRPTDPPVVVINETMARVVFPGLDPVGRRLQTGPDPAAPWLTVVGVVGDVRHNTLETAPPPEIYLDMRGTPPNGPFVAVRTSGDPQALVQTIRAIAREADSTLVLSDFRTMTELRTASLAERRFVLTLVAGFGILAVALAVVGVYGVLTLVVAERSSEMSLRVALGAAPSSVVRLVVAHAMWLSGVGISLGLVVAAGAAVATRSALVGVTAYDPITYVIVPLVLLAGAAIAALVPAVRAMRADPALALRA